MRSALEMSLVLSPSHVTHGKRADGASDFLPVLHYF